MVCYSDHIDDCLDFRPRVDNASTINSGSVDRSFDGTGASAIEFMKNNTDVTADLLINIGARFDDRITGKIDEFSPKSKKSTH